MDKDSKEEGAGEDTKLEIEKKLDFFKHIFKFKKPLFLVHLDNISSDNLKHLISVAFNIQKGHIILDSKNFKTAKKFAKIYKIFTNKATSLKEKHKVLKANPDFGRHLMKNLLIAFGHY